MHAISNSQTRAIVVQETVLAPLAPAPAAPRRVAFANNRAGFRRLAIRGALLELVTVGFYRFWLATDLRRHLWSHTLVDGDTAEYTGTGRELLIGFLFALTILAPVYFAYFLAGLEAERWKAFASFPLGLFFYLFMQFATYRARRYRLTRTIWRGLRFSMTGSGWNYAWRSTLWAAFSALTLGLALPWRAAALERFKMLHTSYGDLPGHFDGKAWDFFKRGWWLWLLAVLLLAGVIGALSSLPLLKNPEAVLATLVAALVTPVLAVPFIYGAYKATEWRWWLSGISFGAVTFTSELRRGTLIALYWKVIGWAALLLTGVAIAGGIIFRLVANATGFAGLTPEQFALAMQQLPVLIGIGLTYIVLALALGVVLRIYLMHDLWRRVADTATVLNLAAADNVMAQGDLVGAIGEGFTDSLDVVGF